MQQGLAYILGAIASDGYAYYIKSNGSYRIGLKVKDKPFADEFAKYLYIVGEKPREYTRLDNKQLYYVVEKGCKKIYEIVHRVKKHEFIFENNDDIYLFIRGYFDGDGHLSHQFGDNYQVGITSVYKDRIEFITSLLKRVGFNPHIYYCKYKNPWRGLKESYQTRIHKRREIKKFMEKIGSSIPRKYKDFSEIKTEKMREVYSDSELIDILKKATNELGFSPTKREFIEQGYRPSITIFMRRFGSWNNAKKQAGIKTYQDGWH